MNMSYDTSSVHFWVLVFRRKNVCDESEWKKTLSPTKSFYSSFDLHYRCRRVIYYYRSWIKKTNTQKPDKRHSEKSSADVKKNVTEDEMNKRRLRNIINTNRHMKWYNWRERERNFLFITVWEHEYESSSAFNSVFLKQMLEVTG